MSQRSTRDVPSLVLFEILVDVPSTRTDPQEIQIQVDVPSTCTTKDVPSNVLRQRSHAVKPLILCEWGYKRILRRLGSPGLSAPLSLCRSHMVGAFSQNNVTLTGFPMILLSESNLTYSCCGVSCYVLLSAPGWFFIDMVPRCIEA
ncbi:hypothetical protein HKD37_15G043923 [Glycine soja]